MQLSLHCQLLKPERSWHHERAKRQRGSALPDDQQFFGSSAQLRVRQPRSSATPSCRSASVAPVVPISRTRLNRFSIKLVDDSTRSRLSGSPKRMTVKVSSSPRAAMRQRLGVDPRGIPPVCHHQESAIYASTLKGDNYAAGASAPGGQAPPVREWLPRLRGRGAIGARSRL